MKLIITATSKERAEELLNKYFYSTSFRIEGQNIFNKNGMLPSYKAIEKKGRIRIYNVGLERV